MKIDPNLIIGAVAGKAAAGKGLSTAGTGLFEDILKVNDKGIQAVLKEVDNSELGLALKTASEDLRNKIFKNMSERAAALIREDMEYMGPVKVSDVESAQQRIVDIVRRLEDAGEVVVEGRGGDTEMLV